MWCTTSEWEGRGGERWERRVWGRGEQEGGGIGMERRNGKEGKVTNVVCY